MAEHTSHSNMEIDDPRGAAVGEMHVRRETMEDGRRYIIYYNFGDEEDTEEAANVRT